MSVSSYTSGDEITALFPRIVESAKTTPGEFEFHVIAAENEINGALARRYTVPFSGGVVTPPIIKTIAQLQASHNWLRAKIIKEDWSKSDWVDGLQVRAQGYLDRLVSGDLALVTTSGTIISPLTLPGRTIWSNTSGYKSTMDHRPPERQRVDPQRILDEDASDSFSEGSDAI